MTTIAEKRAIAILSFKTFLERWNENHDHHATVAVREREGSRTKDSAWYMTCATRNAVEWFKRDPAVQYQEQVRDYQYWQHWQDRMEEARNPVYREYLEQNQPFPEYIPPIAGGYWISILP